MPKDHDTESNITSSFQDEVVESISDLLGGRKVDLNSNICLLRIHSSKLSAAQLSKLKCESVYNKGLVVFGPFKKSFIQKMVDDGILNAFDEVLEPCGRWLPAKDFFEGFSDSEMTSTIEMTQSGTLTGSNTVEMESNEEKKVDSLELELESTESQSSTERENLHKEKSVAQRVGEKQESAQSKNQRSVETKTSAKPKKESFFALPIVQMFLVSISVVLIFIGVKTFLNSNDDSNVVSTTDQMNKEPIPETARFNNNDWPNWIAPLSVKALYEGDDTIYSKLGLFIESILVRDYSWSNSELSLLAKLASPATASWAARKLASNILAVDYFKSGKMQKSQDMLNQIYRATPEDYVVILNLATFSLLRNDLSAAEELSTIALRLCSQSDCWYPNLVKARIKTVERQWKQSSLYYKEANTTGAETIAVLAMWAKSLDADRSTDNSKEVKDLLDRMLWSSPIHTHDTPTYFGLGAELLYQGLSKDLAALIEKYKAEYTPGQKAFLDWRLRHLEGKASVEEALELKPLLAQENSAASALISSYLMSLNGDFVLARETLGSVMALVEEDKLSQPWPWSLAGDLQVQRGALDQAIVFYQSALNRDPRDAASLHGIALIHRMKSDYRASRQKFSESIAVNANFIPSKLRVSRLEWLERFWRK